MESNRIWHLLARKLAGEATQDELQELEKLLQQMPEEAYGIDVYTDYFNYTGQKTKLSPPETNAAWRQHQQRMKEESTGEDEISAAEKSLVVDFQPARHRRKWLVAVSISLIAATAAWWLFLKPSAGKPSIADNSNNNNVVTQPGSRSKLTLPDGSVVWLNSDSRITYNEAFGKEKREVELTGEAFFDVAHNPKVPMVVHARSVNIEVKGTAFNVKAYPEDKEVETSLVRGLVELSTQKDPERKILLRPNEKISIRVDKDTPKAKQNESKDEQTTSTDNLYEVEQLETEPQSNTIPEISWMQNKLVFDGEPFSEVAKKMERWYNVSIEIKSERLAAKKMSGVFEKESLEQALKALQLLSRFRYEIKENKVTIYKK